MWHSLTNWVSGWMGMRGGEVHHVVTGIIQPIPEPSTWILSLVGVMIVLINVKKHYDK